MRKINRSKVGKIFPLYRVSLHMAKLSYDINFRFNHVAKESSSTRHVNALTGLLGVGEIFGRTYQLVSFLKRLAKAYAFFSVLCTISVSCSG